MSGRTLAVVALVVALATASGVPRVAGGASPTRVDLSLAANPVVLTREVIEGAERSVRTVLYKFDEGSLKTAVRAALARGVSVHMVVDEDEARRKRSHVDDVVEAGAEVRVWESGKLHAKFTIVDDRVITGSFNWTESAQHDNVELLVIFDDPASEKRFGELFDDLWQRAKPLDPD